MADNYVTIGDLEPVTSLTDQYKLLIDDSTNGDTKTALVSVLKAYLVDDITPHVNETTNTWFIGSTDTGVKANGIDFEAFLNSLTVCASQDPAKKISFDVNLSSRSGNLLEIISAPETGEDDTVKGLYAKTPDVTASTTDDIINLVKNVFGETTSILVTKLINSDNLQLALIEFNNRVKAEYDQYGTQITSLQSEVAKLNLKSNVGEELTFGYFTTSVDQTAVVNDYIAFDTVKYASGLTLSSGKVVLKKGRTYRIAANLYVGATSGYIYTGIYNVTTGEKISKTLVPISANYSTPSSGSDNIETIYSPSSDCEIGIKIESISASGITLPAAYGNYMVITEINRTYIVDPKDISDRGYNSHGYFTMSTAQTAVVGDSIKFDTAVTSKGITLNTDGSIGLKSGRTYKITTGIYTTNISGFTVFALYDQQTNTIISKNGMAISPSLSANGSGLPNISTIYSPENDCSVCARVTSLNGSQIIDCEYTFFIVEEVARTILVDPLKIKNDYSIEYGSFAMSTSQTTNLSVGYPVRFDTVINGNMNISASTYSVKLKAGTTYKLEANLLVQMTSAGYATFQFKDITQNTYISKPIDCLGVTISTVYNTQSVLSTLYTPDIDCEICVAVATANVTTVYFNYCQLIVYEVSKPIVVEYNNYNEVSNPLTTSDISQESPVGSVISYLGLTAPDHYLVMDGSIYNITDYPELAKHFLNSLGSYNYFGGDGVTTFAVPDARGEFIRGYDPTGIRDQSDGTTRGIGKHQAPTLIDAYQTYSGTTYVMQYSRNTPGFNISNADYFTSASAGAASNTTSSWNGTATIRDNNAVRPTNINVLYCIKYEPTYYAVNQYGGFESSILFDGSITSTGRFNLKDNITNYNFLIVQITFNDGLTYKTSSIIEMNGLKYDGTQNYAVYSPVSSTLANSFGLLYFSAPNILTVAQKSNYIYINRIIGVRGQIPTLIEGGVF